MQTNSDPDFQKKKNPENNDYLLFYSGKLLERLQAIREGIDTQIALCGKFRKAPTTLSEQLKPLEVSKLVTSKGKPKIYSLNEDGAIENLLSFLTNPAILSRVYPKKLQPNREVKKVYDRICASIIREDRFVRAEKIIRNNEKFRKVFLELFNDTLESKNLETIGNVFQVTMRSFCVLASAHDDLIDKSGLTSEEINDLALTFEPYYKTELKPNKIRKATKKSMA